MPANREVTS